MANADLQPAYLLHRRRYRESSLILECFCLDHGRIGLLAKGALSGKQQGLMRPFQPLLLSWRGRGELPVLTGAEPGENLPELKGKQLFCGMYLNELLMRLLARNDPHAQLFSLYSRALADLADADDAALESILRSFELHLLDELGLGLELTVDQDGKAIIAEQRYSFDVHAGAKPGAGPDSIRGSVLLGLSKGQQDSPLDQREARLLMRRVLAIHLGPEPLKSRELFL